MQRRGGNNAAIAAGVTGAIIAGVLTATARRAYRPYHHTYDAPQRTYCREEY